MVEVGKITKNQIKTMLDFISGDAFKNKTKKKDLKLLYHYMTPKDIYVKYISYGLGTDNSIMSNVVVKCIKPDGSLMDCIEQFDNIKQRLEFESGFLEIDLDSNAKIIIL
jgi:hypothetical protein